RTAVLAGRPLSSALIEGGGAVPALLPAMTAAGEQSGGLGTALGRVADDLEERAELASQVRAALLYPAVLAVAAVVGVTLLLTLVVPRFAAIITGSGQTLPWSTRLLLGISGLLAQWWWVLLPACALGVVLSVRWVRAPAGRAWWHAARLRWPLVGTLEESMSAARVLRTMALLLPTGVPLLTALEVAQRGVGNDVLAARVAGATRRLRDGATLGDAFAGALPPLAVQLLAAGERGGDLGALSARAAQHFEQATRRHLRSAVALVEPAIIVLFGGLVAFVALAMLQAIYGINARTL
ncbi:MAG: type II secretion system F family protein, partial [Gemmatimonadaceae bacterium]|nr:type II secretion system F family protein [Gemmatimonadaceae bacterium]